MKMHKKFLRPVIKNRHQEPAEGQGAYCTAHTNRLSIGFAIIRGRSQKERLVAILEMKSLSQSPRDRILWILANNGGKMERSRLRAMKFSLLVNLWYKVFDDLGKPGLEVKNWS